MKISKKHLGLALILAVVSVLAYTLRSYSLKIKTLKTQITEESVKYANLSISYKEIQKTNEKLQSENKSLKKSSSISSKKYYPDGTLKSEFKKEDSKELNKKLELKDLSVDNSRDLNIDVAKKEETKKQEKTEYKYKEEKQSGNGLLWGFLGGIATGYAIHHFKKK